MVSLPIIIIFAVQVSSSFTDSKVSTVFFFSDDAVNITSSTI